MEHVRCVYGDWESVSVSLQERAFAVRLGANLSCFLCSYLLDFEMCSFLNKIIMEYGGNAFLIVGRIKLDDLRETIKSTRQAALFIWTA